MINKVMEVFEGFRMAPTNINEFEQGGREMLATQLDSFVSNNRTIEFMMLGYPFKSTNRVHKTIGYLPDKAEEVSFQNFKRFGEAMAAVYPPGVHLHIVSDGFVFNDLLEEPDRNVDEYAEVSRAMATGSPVTILGLREFFTDALSIARLKVMTEFGIDDTSLEQRILFDHNVNALYRGMIRFMEEELAFKTWPSKRQHHLAAKSLARKMMFRNEAYSAFASHEFPQRIRLSMHPTTNRGKYSFQLIPSPKAWASPWHCALLIEADGTLATIHKMDAEKAGYNLVIENGRPYYYQA